MATSNIAIKITQLPNIGNNIAPSTLIPVVNMAGVPTTQKANLQITGNLILAGAGTANFVPAALANLAYTVVNSNQANITRLGTLNINTFNVSGGVNGYILQTDGTGNLAWVSGGGSGNGVVGGSNTQVQFNDAGDFGGNTGFTFSKTTGILAAPFADVSGVANIVGGGATVATKSVLSVASTFGSNSSAEPASAQAIRGRVTGSNLSKTRNYVTGVTGQYLITGTNASEFIKAGVLGVVGDQTTTADGAVVAYLDGDGGLTTANAAYAVSMKNSTPNSGFNYGLDLQFINLNLGGVTTSTFKQADIRFNNGVTLVANTANNISINANVTVGNIIATNIGNISNINLTGSNSNVLYGNGVFAPAAGGGNANTGNVTFNDINIIGTGNLKLQPDSANASAYLDIFLTAGPDIHIAGNGETVILGTDDYANVAVNVDGNVSIQANAGTPQTWTFGTDGNLTLPADATISDFGNTASLNVEGSGRAAQLYWNGNIGNGNPDTGGDYYTWVYVAETGFTIQYENAAASTDNLWTFGIDGNITLPTGTPSINYANGSPYGGGGGANTGNVTFDDQAVVGTGDSTGGGGLYLAPGNTSVGNLQYLRVRGGDVASHIHLDTGNSQYFDLYIGDDSRSVKIANTGNIDINTNDGSGNSAQWTFGADGNLTLPNGALIKDNAGNAVAFGKNAGSNAQGDYSVAIGTSAGANTQGIGAVAVGNSAGQTSQGIVTVAVGSRAGETSQGAGAVAVGSNAGFQNQGEAAVAVGPQTGVTSQGVTAVAIGYSTGYISQGTNAVAIGAQTGQTSQGNNAVAIGGSAGSYKQGEFSVAIGRDAGIGGEYTATYVSGAYPTGTTLVVNSTTGIATGMFISGNGFVTDQTVVTVTNSTTLQISASADSAPSGTLTFSGYQGSQAVAIGFFAGNTHQGTQSVAVGVGAGSTTQGIQSVAVGKQAGETTQGAYSVAVGDTAGQTTQGTQSVAVGQRAGFSNQGPSAVAIGAYAGNSAQGERTVAVGLGAGNLTQGNNAIAIGNFAGNSTQGTYAIAIGSNAGDMGQGANTVAIGYGAGNAQGLQSIAIGMQAGQTAQGPNNIAIGQQAGSNNQIGSSVAIGFQAGYVDQDTQSVAIGIQAGYSTQGLSAVAIGAASGNSQGANAVAIGRQAGANGQGDAAVAIGREAGKTSQANNSIILNATGSALNQTTANTFTVAPVRNDVSNIAQVMFYNTSSKEVTYGNTISIAGNANVGNIGSTDGVFTGNISGNTNGFAIGYLNIPQVAASNATLALTDASKHFYSTTAGNFTLTVPNNSTTSFATGTAISIVVQAAGNVLVNAVSGVTLYMAGNSTAANRVVGTYGMATLMKVATNTWFINGTGVS